MRYAKKGIQAVDMESTALMAVAMRRRVKFAPVLVISDELFGDKWVPGFDAPKVRKSSRIACEAILGVLNFLS